MKIRNVPFGKPMIDQAEQKAVMDVLSGDVLVHGPKTKEFEKRFAEYTKSPFALSLNSCTAGLHLAYLCLGIGEGDEVIVPAQTHVATVHAVELVGAKPIFVDCDSRTGNIDVNQIESKINSKTKAISVVHFLGLPADMPSIMKIANRHKLKVIEDCALALGSSIDNIHMGLFGDIGLFSFYPVKHITTIEGGMAILKDQEFAKTLNYKKAFGVDKVVGERKVPGKYDVLTLGLNYRMNEVEAAVGICQMDKLKDILNRRESNYFHLRKRLEGIGEIQQLECGSDRIKSSYYCLSIILNDQISNKRENIMAELGTKGIGTSIYYPSPVPHFTYYKQKYGFNEDSFVNAKRISNQSIALSVGPHLNEEDMDYVAFHLKETISKFK
jgi:dTDP-4-amino-4,6-dideoxygalactose transaminase